MGLVVVVGIGVLTAWLVTGVLSEILSLIAFATNWAPTADKELGRLILLLLKLSIVSGLLTTASDIISADRRVNQLLTRLE